MVEQKVELSVNHWAVRLATHSAELLVELLAELRELKLAACSVDWKVDMRAGEWVGH